MFSGIIEEVGRITKKPDGGASLRLYIEASGLSPQLKPGDSVSVDGACLTVESADVRGFTVYSSPETLERTTLTKKISGSPVNLERALSFSDRLNGHIVQGHVDGTGQFIRKEEMSGAWQMYFRLNPKLLIFCVEKGSITLNGISLTIAKIRHGEDIIEVAVIPFTFENTTLKNMRPGDPVNVETDIIGKYIQKFLDPYSQKVELSEDFIRKAGF